MFDFIVNNLDLIKFYMPIGAIGLFRWGLWSIKKLVGLGYHPTKEVKHNSSLSVITAVYNERPDIFKKALNSWEGDEIIAVIDHQDKSSIKVFKEFSDNTYTQTKLIITFVPGKRPSLAMGIKAAKGEIVALVDSDTIWKQDILGRAISPFTDPKVGGVATRQEVYEPSTIQGQLFNIQLSNRYFNEFPFLAKTGNVLTCLSGRTAFYRREAVIPVLDDMVNEKFLGVPCISGDDKALTRLVQEKGWKTKFMQNVVVATPQAPTLLTFFKQQLRWLRNSWRSDLLTLASPWVWKREKILALYMIDRFLQPFIMFLGPIYFAISIYLGHWTVSIILIIWWLLSRSIKILPHLEQHTSDLLIIPVYVITTYITALIKIYALLTLNEQGWITRWDSTRLQKTALIFIFMFMFQTSGISSVKAQEKPDITFDSATNTIEVKGEGTTVNLTAISNVINDKNVLERTGVYEWILKVNLKIFEDVTLELYGFQGGDVNWLKMRSDPAGYAAIESSNGNISIKNVKITSWDGQKNSFDTDFLDGSGRAYISAKNRSSKFVNRMDIVSSEIAYLGFFDETAYGISWKVISEPGKGDTGTLGKGITGKVENSKFHHNYYGMYLWGAGGLVIRNNEIYENYRYGFDAHTQTINTIMEDNFSHDNGWHGIIFADRCTGNTIRRNRSINNKGHGIMLHKRSDNNTIEDNTVSGNDDGIPLFESSSNIIKNNRISGNNVGVRVYGRTLPSANNIFENNTISDSKKYGIYLYDAASENTFRNNQIQNSGDREVYEPNVSNDAVENTNKPNKWIIASTLFGAVFLLAVISRIRAYLNAR